MSVTPPTTPEQRLTILDEIVARLFGRESMSATELANLLTRLRQLPRPPRVEPRLVLSDLALRLAFPPVLSPGQAVPVQVTTDTTAALHELTMHEFGGAQVWPASGKFAVVFGSSETVDLDVAAGVTGFLGWYIVKLWVEGTVVDQETFVTTFF